MISETRQQSQPNKASAAEIRAKIAMLRMGITPADLSERAGLCLGHVYNLLSGYTVTKKGRRAIERVLGPVWSGLNLKLHKEAFDRIGFSYQDAEMVVELAIILGDDPDHIADCLEGTFTDFETSVPMRIRALLALIKRNDFLPLLTRIEQFEPATGEEKDIHDDYGSKEGAEIVREKSRV